jgi:hypothetical protein
MGMKFVMPLRLFLPAAVVITKPAVTSFSFFAENPREV